MLSGWRDHGGGKIWREAFATPRLTGEIHVCCAELSRSQAGSFFTSRQFCATYMYFSFATPRLTGEIHVCCAELSRCEEGPCLTPLAVAASSGAIQTEP